MPHLEAVATAVPGPPHPQTRLKEKAAELLNDLAPNLLEYLEVFDNTGIRQRHLVRPVEWYLEAHGWKERADIYREAGLELLESAARAALRSAGIEPHAIDGIVLVSTTGISTPSLDARLVNRMDLRSDVVRVPVWGLGCAGGVSGLGLAGDLARANPRKRYLLLSLELCSLAFNLAELDLRGFVAATLFADGAAAAIIGGDEVQGPALATLRKGSTHEWHASEEIMGWDVLDSGLGVVFSRKIPSLVEANLGPVVRAYTAREETNPNRYLFHPGGAKVIEAYQRALGLEAHQLAGSSRILQDYGNMSSPTVLFVLEDALRTRRLDVGESALLAALGPGFASELLLLDGPHEA